MNYCRELIAVGICVFLVLSNPAICVCQDDNDHLELSGQDITLSAWRSTHEYLDEIRKLLLKDDANVYSPYMRVVVIPGNDPEWMITIDKPNGDNSTIELKVLDKALGLYVRPVKRKVHIYKATLRGEISTKLKEIWDKMLWDVKYTHAEVRAKDDVHYTYIGYSARKGMLAGTTWAPKEFWFLNKKKLNKLVTISNKLRELALAENHDASRIEKEIGLVADRLIEELR